MGIVTTGCAIGGVSYPIMFQRLVPNIGFAWVLRIAALKTMSVGSSLMCNVAEHAHEFSFCFLAAFYLTTHRCARRKTLRGVFRTLYDFEGFRDPRYTILCLGAWLSQLGIWIPSYYIGTHLQFLRHEELRC